MFGFQYKMMYYWIVHFIFIYRNIYAWIMYICIFVFTGEGDTTPTIVNLDRK